MELKTILGVMAIAWTVWTEYRMFKITEKLDAVGIVTGGILLSLRGLDNKIAEEIEELMGEIYGTK